MIRKDDIDGGTAFDWGRTSADYARYRDIYPAEFLEKVVALGLCPGGGQVLDLGTGTGVIPRALYGTGARFTGVDISPQQIAQAERMSAAEGKQIEYHVCPAEALPFADNRFDVVTACQCFKYFDVDRLLPRLKQVLKPRGRLAILSLWWLPFESEIARQSEQMVLRFSPRWDGGSFRRRTPAPPAWAANYGFSLAAGATLSLALPFTRESWNGRMKACRGVGASLPPQQVARFEQEHLRLLQQIAPPQFTIPHQALMLVLQNHKQ